VETLLWTTVCLIGARLILRLDRREAIEYATLQKVNNITVDNFTVNSKRYFSPSWQPGLTLSLKLVFAFQARHHAPFGTIAYNNFCLLTLYDPVYIQGNIYASNRIKETWRP
jgi:hypothetical protein